MNRISWFLSLVFVPALLAACSAEFKSGVTACGAKEPRCPAGYTCMNNVRCVKMGDNIDVGRADGGVTPGKDAAVTPPLNNPDAPVQMDAAAPAQDAGLVAMDVASNPDVNIVPAGQAVVKFCNPIRLVDGNPLELELVIGSLRLKASTRQCSSAVEMACQGLAAGPVKMQLLRNGMPIATRDVTLDQSGQYLVYARYDGMANSLDVMKLAVGQNCPEFDFPPVAYLKFCNQIVARDQMGAVMDINLDLAWGMEKVSATSGKCNTMDNLACYYTRSGQVRLALQDAGKEIAFLMANLQPNGNYGVLAQVDGTTRQPKLTLVPMQAGQTCAAYKPPSAPPPVYDGGVSDARAGN